MRKLFIKLYIWFIIKMEILKEKLREERNV